MFKEKLMVALGALCLALFTGAAFAQNADTRWQDQPRVAELLNEIVRTLPSGHSRLCRVAHGPIPPDTRQELFDNVVFEVLIADTNQSFEVKSRNITITDASFCTSDPRHCAQGGEWWIYYCASGEGLFMGTAGRNFLPHIITSIRQEATPFNATQLDAGRVNAQAIEIEAGELNTYQFRAIQVALGIDTAEFVRQGLGSSQGNEFEQRRVLERRLDTLRQGARQYSGAQSIDFVFRDVPVLVGPYDFSRGAFAISVPERLSVNTIAEDIPNSALTAILVWDGVWSGCN